MASISLARKLKALDDARYAVLCWNTKADLRRADAFALELEELVKKFEENKPKGRRSRGG